MQEKIWSVGVHRAVNSFELGLWWRMLFDQMMEYRGWVCPRINEGVWKGCRWIEAEWYRQEKRWWKCWSTGLKSCSQSLSRLETSESFEKEAVHDHTCKISWLILLQNYVLFEACQEWIVVSHRGGCVSVCVYAGESWTLTTEFQRRIQAIEMRYYQ